jgi:uncharacterized glyoxalase superfamily protein PhnB
MKLTGLRPMLETESLQETIEFYTSMLGFTCEGVYPNTENPYWASLRKDNVSIMFTARNDHSIFDKTLMTGSLYFNTDEVDRIWEELKDKAKIEYPIENFNYCMREFAIRDPNGYLLQFGQEISE